MSESLPNFKLLSYLFLFLFGGAIVGETVSLSMVVSIEGPGVLGRLYLINGLLLFLLPPLFFNYIDRLNRGRLLSIQLVVIFSLLCGYLFFSELVYEKNNRFVSFFLESVYAVSYLSKTVLFLTFWTLANDICFTREAKKEFPKIAAWGFLGGLSGAILSRLLLEVIKPELIIGLWAIGYFIAYGFALRIVHTYRVRLIPKESVPKTKRENYGIINDIRNVFSVELVRLIAGLYFLVFIAVFLIDFLFWKLCSTWFITSKALASFQFTFYISHGIVTIIGLLLITPFLLTKLGLTKMFMLLPLTLFLGSSLVYLFILGKGNAIIIFSVFICVQFMRYVVFENAFSPIYQMFFASIPMEQRGRAKTIIEGVIKPAGIISAGVLCLELHEFSNNLYSVIIFVSVIMVWIVSRIRISYIHGLVPTFKTEYKPDDIIAEIGSHYDQKIVSLMKEYFNSESIDLRCLAVKILAQLGSKQALKILVTIYDHESDETVREMIAGSLTNFYWYETKQFVDRLLKDKNYRIRSNAIHSMNTMNCYWKWRLKDNIKALLFENNIRVQIEAAQFLWQGNDRGERENVDAFLQYLLRAKNENKRSAGVYLVSILRPQDWENTLKDNLQATSIQVFTRCIEVILASASKKTKLETLSIVENFSRQHITITGKTLQKIGKPVVELVLAYLQHAKNRRMIFEMVHALRTIRDATGSAIRKYALGKETEEFLQHWILDELHGAYLNAFVWNTYKNEMKISETAPCALILEDALSEHMFRVCEWSLDTMALLESEGIIALGRKDLDLTEKFQRLNMIEIVESFTSNKLRSLIIPILEFESWDTLAKIGKQFFAFNTDSLNDLRYFFHAENKWICLSALYCLRENPNVDSIIEQEKQLLNVFASNPREYPYLSNTAKMFLTKKTEPEGGDTVNSFTLLETVLFFKKTLLFRNVPAEKLMGLAEISKLVSYNKGALISKEGDISDHLYIIKSGSLRIVKTKNNVKTVLSIIRGKEEYGEIGLFNQAPRSASAYANENCEIYVIQRSSLKKLLLDIPEIAYNFLEIFSEKLRKNSEDLTLVNSTMKESMKADEP